MNNIRHQRVDISIIMSAIKITFLVVVVLIGCLLSMQGSKSVAVAQYDESAEGPYDDDLPMPSKYEDHYGPSAGAIELEKADDIKKFVDVSSVL